MIMKLLPIKSNEKFKYILGYLSNLKEYLPIILLFASISGGLGQFINLLWLSPNYLEFYSASQLFVKGALYISFLLGSVIICLICLLFILWNKKYLELKTSICSIILLILIYFEPIPKPIFGTAFLMTINILVALFIIIPIEQKDDRNDFKTQYDLLFKYGFHFRNTIIMILYNFFIFQFYYGVNREIAIKKDIPLNIPNKVYLHDDTANPYKLTYFNSEYVFYKNHQGNVIVKNIDYFINDLNIIDSLTIKKQEVIKEKEYKKDMDSLVIKTKSNMVEIQNKHDSLLKVIDDLKKKSK